RVSLGLSAATVATMHRVEARAKRRRFLFIENYARVAERNANPKHPASQNKNLIGGYTSYCVSKNSHVSCVPYAARHCKSRFGFLLRPLATPRIEELILIPIY